MDRIRKSDIDTIKNGLKLAKEICTNHVSCDGCPLQTHVDCILIYPPCDILDTEIDEVFGHTDRDNTK